MPLESVRRPLPGPRQWVGDFGGIYLANALVGFVFAASGPVAIVLAVGARGGLSESDLSSWIFGSFFLNGLITLLFCTLYRQPLVFFWTIPGTVLVGPALGHLRWAEVVGAFIATGLLMLVLGLSGWVRRAMQAVPMPIVMAMVAGVFLRFGLGLVYAVRDDVWIAAPMIVVFLALGASPAWSRRLPPLIGALFVGAAAVAAARPVSSERLGAARLRPPEPVRAGVLVARDGGARRAARGHRARGAERPGLRGAQGRPTRPAGQRDHRRLRRGLGARRAGRHRLDLPDRTRQRDHLGLGRARPALHRGPRRGRVRDRVRAVFARVHAADAGDATGIHRRARRARDAARAADGVHRVVPRALHARCADHVPRHGRRCADLQRRRAVLGAGDRLRRVARARAQGLRRRRAPEPDADIALHHRIRCLACGGGAAGAGGADRRGALCRTGGALRPLRARPTARVRTRGRAYRRGPRGGADVAAAGSVRGPGAAARASGSRRAFGTAGHRERTEQRLGAGTARVEGRSARNRRALGADRHAEPLAQSSGRGRPGRRWHGGDRRRHHPARRRHA